MAELVRPRILLVDDEVNVLEGLRRHLRPHFDVTIALGAQAALELAASHGPYEVVVSDLQMPGMDGVTLLSCIRKVSPDTVRVLLTGHADVDAAVAAVNEGNIFRFLNKPCPSGALLRALEASVEQYRLITAERVLLEQTLRGSLQTLTDILAFVNPVAFGRALRTRKIIGELAHLQKAADPWQAEIAAMLAQIGWVTLPAETSSKLYHGKELSASEQALVDNLPAVTAQLLGNIPRLDPVREILRHKDTRYDGQGTSQGTISGNAIPWGARALKAVSDFDVLESRGFSPELALDAMRARTGWYDPAILEALASLRGGKPCDTTVIQLPLQAVQPGMVFAEDVKTHSGLLLIARGQEVTLSLVERIKNMALNSKINAPVLVIVPVQPPIPASAGAASIPSGPPPAGETQPHRAGV
ncbi:MAG: HD domain-containing phosphohydrolase [Terriglobia bacterium]|jgi:response regulator RpfG family c-di-GMP phosphodiesterase